LEQDNSFYVDIGGLKKLPGDTDSLNQIRNAMDRIIYEFINFYKITKRDSVVSNLTPSVKEKTHEIENDSTIAEPLGHCAIPLYAAFLLLNWFLSSNGIDFSSAFSAFENYISSKIRCADLPESAPISLEQVFIQYIRNVFCGQHKVEYDYWTGKERNSPNEECYYLDKNRYLEDFCQYCGHHVTSADIDEMLERKEWAKVRRDRKNPHRVISRGLERKHYERGHLLFDGLALVLYKGKIDGCNSPTEL
jgi:hypothetical protein